MVSKGEIIDETQEYSLSEHWSQEWKRDPAEDHKQETLKNNQDQEQRMQVMF